MTTWGRHTPTMVGLHPHSATFNALRLTSPTVWNASSSSCSATACSGATSICLDRTWPSRKFAGTLRPTTWPSHRSVITPSSRLGRSVGGLAGSPTESSSPTKMSRVLAPPWRDGYIEKTTINQNGLLYSARWNLNPIKILVSTPIQWRRQKNFIAGAQPGQYNF